MEILDGKIVANNKKNELISELNKIGKKMKLVVIQVGNDSASSIYIRNKEKICKEVGILFECIRYDNITQDDLINKIRSLNDDKEVTGILVQLPLPKDINTDKVLREISSVKDVDGLTSYNMGKLFNCDDSIVPCTALGIMELLDSYKIDLEGRHVVIVGRSRLVGLPLISLFLQKNATVTVCHSETINLKSETSRADILVVAVCKNKFIKKDFIKEGAIVIDAGINILDGKLYGDCDFDDIKDKCLFITPVPGGVGALTTVMLINNVIKAYKLQNK